MSIPDFLLHPSKQSDWIVDMYWRLITKDDRNKIITQINNLPILSELDEIIYAIENNVLVIIDAKTWSGKTTQVWKIAPFINLWKKGLNYVNMTQPRVIAASSNSNRISQELLAQQNDPTFSLWYKVWYKTWITENASTYTRLLLTTDWLEVMRQLVSWILPDILILDEVHNYTVATEILLAKVKEYLTVSKKNIKVVIMSATLDKPRILDYFKEVSTDIPYFEVPWRIHKITDIIRKESELVSSVIELDEKTWKSGLVFMEGKWPIYNTITDIKSELKNNELDKLIFNLEEDFLNTILKNFDSYFEVQKDLLEFKDISHEILSLKDVRGLISMLTKELHNKLKNPNYSMNMLEIFNIAFDLLSSTNLIEKFNEKLSKLIIKKELLLTDIGNNNLTIKEYEEEKKTNYKNTTFLTSSISNLKAINIENKNDIISLDKDIIKYESFLNIVSTTLSEDNDNTYNYFIDKTNSITDKLEVIDNDINDFNLSIKKDIFDHSESQINWLIEFIDSSFRDIWFPKKMNLDYMFENIISSKLKWILFKFGSYFYDINLNWRDDNITSEMINLVNELLWDNGFKIYLKKCLEGFISQIKSKKQFIGDNATEDKKEYFKNLDKKIIEINKYIDENIVDDYYDNFIESLNYAVENIEAHRESWVDVVPFHSDLPIEYIEEKVMSKWKKIRVSTNIAEMSVTLPNTWYVVDNWKEKTVKINEHWVEVLYTQNISKAQSNQRRWRTWREGPWYYVWANNSDIDNLEPFPETDIEKQSLDRYYLVCLSAWYKLEDMDFFHKPKDYAIKLAKDKLKLLGAITKNNEITSIWEFILSLPVETHIWKILYEWVMRNCVWDLINISSILWSKDFVDVKNAKWKKLFSNQKTYKKSNDIFFLEKVFMFATAKDISKETYNELIFLWINKIKLDEFLSIHDKPNKKLYEYVDLTFLWINDKYLWEILMRKKQMKKSLENLLVPITYTDDLKNKDIKYSIISWFPDNVFKFDRLKKEFHNKKWYFRKASLSTIDTNSWLYFVWWPFIINNWVKENAFLSRVIAVDKEDLKEVFNKDKIAWNNKINLQTWIVSVLSKKGKKINKRVPILKQQALELSWFKISDITYEVWNDSFEWMFKEIYLPNLLINNNNNFINLIKTFENSAPEWYIFNKSKFLKILVKYTNDLYDYFINSKKNIRKLENYFKNDELTYKKMMIDEDEKLVDFLENPYIEQFD